MEIKQGILNLEVIGYSVSRELGKEIYDQQPKIL